ncbi:hypothetical protein [Phenylobacterium sp.]|jgi:hypothetical protein|uniref:hypothetical protein n=1 Tax=Phenylobacterium sp. TaxID=1871053 RepID=UPI002F922F2A
MMGFLRAHGMDAGPLQRPILAGVLTGLAATVPAALPFLVLGSFEVAADQVMRLPRPLAAGVLVGAFTLSGALYGLVLRRAANDRRGGWLFGAVFGFVLWLAAPVVVLPLMGSGTMAAGRAAAGFLASFLVWGVLTGALFPLLHAPLKSKMDGGRRGFDRVGPSGAAFGQGLLRRLPRNWR